MKTIAIIMCSFVLTSRSYGKTLQFLLGCNFTIKSMPQTTKGAIKTARCSMKVCPAHPTSRNSVSVLKVLHAIVWIERPMVVY